MEIGKLPMAIVGITIAVIVCAVLLIPVVQESTTTHETFINEGYFRMNKITTGNLSFNWDYDTPGTITVNGENIQYNNNSGLELSVVCSDTFYLRIRDNNASFIYNGPGGNVVADSTGESLTVTIVDNSGTVTNGTDTKTFTNTGDIYHISNTGDYVMKKSNESAYMNSDSQIFIRGVSRIGTHYVSFVVSGDIEDGPTITASDVTLDNVKMNSTPISNYIDLYKFDSVTFDATYTGESTPTSVTYSYVVVPYQVIAERSVHPDATTTQLINVIPILVIIGIVMLAVGTMIYYRR